MVYDPNFDESQYPHKPERSDAPRPTAMIEVSRRSCWLKLWLREDPQEQFHLYKQYKISPGMKEFPTPKANTLVNGKVQYPDWRKPDSKWVPEDQRGVVIPGGHPDNPLKERWIGLLQHQGIGIHGTADLEHLGQPASHGCIRMAPDDVKEVYSLTPLYSIVIVR